jgi:hypothetical protein
MQAILRILKRAGAYRPTLCLRVENPPYMVLIIEAMPEPGQSQLRTMASRMAISCVIRRCASN